MSRGARGADGAGHVPRVTRRRAGARGGSHGSVTGEGERGQLEGLLRLVGGSRGFRFNLGPWAKDAKWGTSVEFSCLSTLFVSL